MENHESNTQDKFLDFCEICQNSPKYNFHDFLQNSRSKVLRLNWPFLMKTERQMWREFQDISNSKIHPRIYFREFWRKISIWTPNL